MKIGIIGLGIIGSACKYGFEKLGHQIFVHDIKMNTKIEDVLETEIDKKKIAITHFPDAAKKLAQSGRYDVIFYGHTHRAWDELVLRTSAELSRTPGAEGKKCHMINPGELAGQFYKPTFAVYDIKTGDLELKILEKI